MPKVKVRDVLERAVWTFLQAFVAVLVASGTDYIHVNVLRNAAIAAGAAALSAIKTTVVGVPGGSPVP